MRLITSGACPKITPTYIYVARTSEDLSPYICNVCEFLGTHYCIPSAKFARLPQTSCFATGHCMQGRNDGRQGGINPRHWISIHGGAESLRGAENVTWGRRKIPTMSHNTVNFLPKDLRFEHGGAKLASCPGCRPTSLRPWPHEHNKSSSRKKKIVVLNAMKKFCM